jgi:predicted unusual protein kinase regulating ubiquinone biosynthesis (AarF/ABC1/UbiB family)
MLNLPDLADQSPALASMPSAPKPQSRVNRFTQTVRALSVARLLLWTMWVIYRERRRMLRARERGDTEAQPDIQLLIEVLVSFRKTAVELGGLMIKLGQFLSSRADLLPQQALGVLSSLQDEVPPAPFSHVVCLVESELHKPVTELFSSLAPEATAAASLGQVHRATLPDTGQVVAVKVQRPDIRRLVDMDLSTFRFVLWVISRFVDTSEFIDLWAFFGEFKRTISEELDYVREAANAKRLGEIFKDRPHILIPKVIDGYTSRRVLVLEWVDGIKVNDYPQLEQAGVSRMAVARNTVDAYFYQFFEIGFFHADPHPGNIFVQPGPSPTEPIIALVDFGMVGSLTRSTRQGLTDLLLGFVFNKPHDMVVALSRLGFIGEGANLSAIERGVGRMMEQYQGMTLAEARNLNVSEVAHELEDLVYRQPFRIPAQFAFFGRAIGTLSGLATGLAPQSSLVTLAVPYARNLTGLNREGAGKTAQDVIRQVLDTGRVALALPTTLERVLTRLESGDLEVRVAENGRNGATPTHRRHTAPRQTSSGIVPLVVCLASLAAGVILTLNQVTLAAWFCLGVGGLVAASLPFRR